VKTNGGQEVKTFESVLPLTAIEAIINNNRGDGYRFFLRKKRRDRGKDQGENLEIIEHRESFPLPHTQRSQPERFGGRSEVVQNFGHEKVGQRSVWTLKPPWPVYGRISIFHEGSDGDHLDLN